MREYKKRTFVKHPEPVTESDPDAVTRKEIKDMARKKDLVGLARKSDLLALATKEDLDKISQLGDIDRFALKKNLSSYVLKGYLDRVIEELNVSKLATKLDLVDYSTKRDLDNFVTKDELYKLVNPSKLSEFLTSKSLAGLVKREELAPLLKREEALHNAKPKQVLSGNLNVSGELLEAGKRVKTVGSPDRSSTRIVNQAPAHPTARDKVVVVMNESDSTFGVVLPKGDRGHELVIKDGSGNSYTSTVKIVGAENASSGKQELIDGKDCLFLREDYGCVRLVFNGKEWNII